MPTKNIFCAACQSVKPMQMSLDRNGEIVALCECGRHLKFPNTGDAIEIDRLIASHHESNVGQISTDMAEAAQKEHDERFKRSLGIA